MSDNLFFVLYREAPGDAWTYDSDYNNFDLADLRWQELYRANREWEVVLAEATLVFNPELFKRNPRIEEEEDEEV